MHPDIQRGMRLAWGARMGSILFTLTSFLIGVGIVVTLIGGGGVLLVLLYGGR